MDRLVGMKVKRMIYLCTVLFVSSFTVGCASFSGNQLVDIENIHGSSPVEESVYFHYEQIANGKVRNDIQSSEYIKKQKRMIQEITRESGLFSGEYLLNTDGDDKSKYVLKYKLNTHGNSPMALISGLISGWTLAVIPGFGVDHYTLTAELYSPEGELIWNNAYDDKMTTVIWLPFIPLMFNPDNRTEKRKQTIWNNMYRYPLKDIYREKILSKNIKYSERQ